MIQCERIDVSAAIDLTKRSDKSKEYMICHYWYFNDNCYKYEPHVCNGCHNLSMVVYNLNDFMILNVKCVDYGFYVFNISKSDAIKLLNNSVLDDKEVL